MVLTFLRGASLVIACIGFLAIIVSMIYEARTIIAARVENNGQIVVIHYNRGIQLVLMPDMTDESDTVQQLASICLCRDRRAGGSQIFFQLVPVDGKMKSVDQFQKMAPRRAKDYLGEAVTILKNEQAVEKEYRNWLIEQLRSTASAFDR